MFAPYNPPTQRAKTGRTGAVTTDAPTPSVSNRSQVLKSLLSTSLRPLPVNTVATPIKTEPISPPVSAPLRPLSVTASTSAESQLPGNQTSFTEDLNFDEDMFLDY